MDNIRAIALHPDKLRIYDESEVKKQEKIFSQMEGVLYDLEDVPYAMVKGQVLSQIAYGKTGYRKSHDIDLLVRHTDLPVVSEIFARHGFENIVCDEKGNCRELTRKEKIMYINSHQTAPFVKWDEENSLKVEVDVNTALMGGETKNKALYVDDFLSDTSYITLFKKKVKILNKYKAFIHLALHHYREMNAPYIFKICNPINSRMFEDVYRFYTREIAEHPNHLLDLSTKYNMNEYLYFIFYYTSIVFRDKRIKEAVDLFYSEAGAFLIEKYGLSDGERKIWNIGFLERLDLEDIYMYVSNDLSNQEKRKIETVWSVIK